MQRTSGEISTRSLSPDPKHRQQTRGSTNARGCTPSTYWSVGQKSTMSGPVESVTSRLVNLACFFLYECDHFLCWSLSQLLLKLCSISGIFRDRISRRSHTVNIFYRFYKCQTSSLRGGFILSMHSTAVISNGQALLCLRCIFFLLSITYICGHSINALNI